LGTRLTNIIDTSRQIENLPSATGHESLRWFIPRALVMVLDIRNRRGVGHPGGEVLANEADARFVVSAADWVLAELVRLDQNMPFEEAQELVDRLSIVPTPLVQWIG